MGDERDNGNGDNVHPFPDKRQKTRRETDVSDEWLRMMIDNLHRRLDALERKTDKTHDIVVGWKGAIALLVTGAGVLWTVLKLLGKV